jgi:hypothetical protein
MKESIKTVFQCDFCKKTKFTRHAMKVHEARCGGNPDNYTACSDCIYLENIKITISYSEEGYSRELTREVCGFRCSKLKQKLYPPLVKHKGLLEKWPDTFNDQIAMPSSCSHHDNGLGF